MRRVIRTWLYVLATIAGLVLYTGPRSNLVAAAFTWTGMGNPPDTWNTVALNWTNGAATAWVNSVDRSTPNTANFSTAGGTIVVNDNIGIAFEAVKSILRAEQLKRDRQVGLSDFVLGLRRQLEK